MSTVFTLLQDHQRLRQTRDLYVVGAKCHAFLSWASGDLGRFAAAAAHGRTALILGEEAGHSGAQALALCALSKMAYWDGDLARAGVLARRGYELCPPNRTRVLLACQEADAVPVAQARDAIARARRDCEEAAGADDLGGLFASGPVRVANYAASLYLRSGEPGAVIGAARIMPVPGEQVGYGTLAQLRIATATAYLSKGDVDGAAAELGEVLALPSEQRLATLTDRLSTLPPILGSGRFRAVAGAAGLAERIRTYCDDASQGRAALPAGHRGDES